MTIQNGLDVLSLHSWALEVPVTDMATTLGLMSRIDAVVHKTSFSHQVAIRGMILSLLAPHFRTNETANDRRKRQDVQRLADVVRFISENIKTGVRISELPGIASMSRSYFAQKFRAAFGISPQEYIRKQRIELVKRELRASNIPLSILAEDNGYSSASHMTREFKHHTGFTPKDFRELDRYFD